MHFPRCFALAVAASFLAAAPHSRGQVDGFDLWQEISDQQATARVPASLKATAQRDIVPQVYRTLALNKASMAQLLAAAPSEAANRDVRSGSEIILPLPQGGYGRFSVLESPLMEAELAAEFPEIKNYILQGLDDPTATGRIDTSPKGFRAMVISAEGTFFIDPYWSNTEEASICYAKKDFVASDKMQEWSCGVVGDNSPVARAARALAAQPRPTGATLRVYRAAIAATGEYTAVFGGTVSGALAAINTTLARVTTVYEREFCIRMVLVGNNSSIIYTNGATDPYTNNNGSTMLGQNQTNLDNVIGNANYDIGHVFSTGGGGVAYLGVVCETGAKAGGVTGSSSPVGDPFDIDYVAHEMGHQFAGNHTFNGTSGSASGNRNATTAFEPGSGSTIMAYAGICAPQDLQNNSDDYFHTGSYTEIDNYTSSGTGAGAISNIATGNSPPVIGALTNYTIPAQTPFALTASATDANGDVLTYCWEEYDTGPTNNPIANPRDNGASPILRSYNPTTNSTRLFPSLRYILGNTNVPPATYVTNGTTTNATGEFLPTTSRTMTYRVSVRDNRAGGGGQNWASAQVTTVSNSAPFRISSQNTASTVAVGTPFNVTWDVAGTTNAPISATNVKISLSTNGGTNFPVVLAASVPNNGTASVTIPAGNTATAGRLKVEAVGNIFFDVNDASLTVSTAFVAGQITLSDTNAFTENFDSMGTNAAAALPNGFKMTAAGQGTSAGWENTNNVTATSQQASSVSNTNATTGGRYNWGSSATERAAGFMTSGSYASPNGVMAKVVNDSGSTMTGLNVAFDIERYRINTAAAQVNFFSSTDGVTWSAVPAGDSGAFSTGTSAYTFTGGTVVSKTLSLDGLSVANGSAIYIKWVFVNTGSSSSQGLGLDNLTLQAVVPSANAPVITSASTASAVGFISFSYQITATQSPTSYNATGLPAGLLVDTATGLISGTPTEQGTFNVTLSASNASGTGTGPLTLTVTKNPGAPTITSALTASGELNAPFSYQILASNSPNSYSASNLPTGLAVDPVTGLISGTPTVAGSRNVTITASNALGTDTQTLVLFIGAVPAINAPITGSAYTNAAVSWQVSATGPATSYSATGLPAGFTINTSTGLITGTAGATPGTSTFQVTATNPLGSDTKTFTLAVLDQAAQNAIPLNVVVNKYANSTPDQIQLLVVGSGTPGSTADMRGMIIKDFSSSMGGDGGGKYAFADNALWAAVPSGSFITLSTGATATEDFDLADFYAAVNLDNTTYFTNVGGVAMDIATTEMIMIKAAGTGALGVAGGIHCMGSGTAGAQFTAFLGAKLLGTSTTGVGFGAFANNATSALIDYGTSGGAAATGATGNTAIASLDFTTWNNASNQTFVLSLRGSSTTPTIIVSPTSLNLGSTAQGTPGSISTFAASGSNLTADVTVNAPTGFEVSTNGTTFAPSVTLTASGTLGSTTVSVRLTGSSTGSQSGDVTVASTGATTRNVAVNGTVTAPPVPSITATPSTITNLGTTAGTPSDAQSFAASGALLSDNITVSANDAINFAVSTNSTSGFASSLVLSTNGSGAVPSTPVYVRLTANSAGSFTNTVSLVSGALSTNVTVGGIVTSTNDPFVNVTPVSLSGFTAIQGANSTNQTVTISGTNLTGAVSVTAAGVFEVSTNGTNFANSVSVSLPSSSGTATNFTTSTTWVTPAGVTSVQVEAWGAGGAGGSAWRTNTGNSQFGGGGAGGAYAKRSGISVVPGATNFISVGIGSSNTSSINDTRLSGGDSWFNTVNSSNSAPILAKGGEGGESAIGFTNDTQFGLGGLGTTSGSVGDLIFAGGSGANAPSVGSNVAGGGGSGAGTAANGTSATSNIGATAPPSGGGDGGSGAAVTGVGTNGVAPGGGGGGARASGTQFAGGAGGNGMVIVTPQSLSPVLSNTTIYVRMAASAVLGTNTGSLTIASTGASNRVVSLGGSVTSPLPAVINRNPTTLSNFTTLRGNPSTNQPFTLSGSNLTANITVGPLEGWQVSLTGNSNEFSSSLVVSNNPSDTLTNTFVYIRLAGTNTNAATYTSAPLPLTSGTNASNNVLLSGAVTNPPAVITVNPNALTNFTTTLSNASTHQSFDASGTGLTSNITVAPSTNNFAISFTTNNADFTTNSLTLTNNGGTATNRTVYVRMTGAAVGTFTNAVNLVSGTASTNVTVSGTVSAAGPPSITLNPTNATNLVAFVNAPGTAQQITVAGTNLPGVINFAADSSEYEVAPEGGTFGNTNSLPTTGGVALVRIKSGNTAGAVGSAQLVFESGTGLSKVTTSIPLAGQRIANAGVTPSLQNFLNDLTFTPTAQFDWALVTNSTAGRGTNFSAVNVGGNLTVSNGARFNILLNSVGSKTAFTNNFWSAQQTWPVFAVTSNTVGNFILGAVSPDSEGNYYAGYGSFSVTTNAGGVNVVWTPFTSTNPTITVNTTNLTVPGAITNAAGTSTNFTAGGTNLQSGITVSVPGSRFAVSTNPTTGFGPSLVLATNGSGVVVSTPVYVQLTASATAGTFTNTISLTSLNATTRAVEVTGTVNDPNSVAIRVNTNALAGFETTRGTPSSPPQNLTVTGTNLGTTNITVASSNTFYEISTNSFATAGSNTLTLAPTGGVLAVRISTNAPVTNNLAGGLALSSGGASTNVSLSGVVKEPPTLTANASLLTNFFTVQGTASPAQSYTLSGSNIFTNVTVTAPANFQVALTNTNAAFGNSVSPQATGGGVLNTNIWVRVSASAPTNTNLTGTITNAVSTLTNALVTLQARVAPVPTLGAAPTNLTGFSTVFGVESTNQSFNLTASNLLGPVNLSVTNGYEVSLGTNSGFVTNLAVALTIASDNGSNYTNSSWTNGANGGSGFGPWNLSSSGGTGGFGGQFVGNPADADIVGMATNSFGLFANPINSGSFATAERAISNALAVGQSLTFEWGINYDSGTNGNKGFILFVGTNQVVNVNNAGSSAITLNGSDVGFGYGTNVMTWSFTRTASNALSITANDRDGTGTFATNLVVSNTAVDSVKFYASAMQAGNKAQPYFNNLKISYANSNISNLPIYVRIATNAPVKEPPTNLASRVTISTTNALSNAIVNLTGNVFDRPAITVVPVALSNLVATSGYAGVSTNFLVSGRNLTNDLQLSAAPTNYYQISTNNSAFTNTITLVRSNGVVNTNTIFVRISPLAPLSTNANSLTGNVTLLSLSAATNVSLTGRVLEDSTIPVVETSTNALSGLGSVEGSAGGSTNFNVNGRYLRGNIVVTAPVNFAISTNNSDFGLLLQLAPDIDRIVPSTPVYVRIAETAPVGAVTGNIVLNSSNLPAPKNVAVSGMVTNWPIANPYSIRVTNPVAPVSTNGGSFTFSGQVGAGIDRTTLSWFNLLNDQSNNFAGNTNWTWSASVPLDVGYNTLVFSGQFLTNAGTTNIASDAPGDAAYAPPGGWVGGDNGGYGFKPWQLYAEDGFSACYRTDIWASTNMNVSGFYGFALESIVGALANAYRPFAAPLQAPGGSFTVWFDSNDLQPGGVVGMQLVSSNTNALFTFAAANNGSGSAYQISDKTNMAVNPGWAYAPSGLFLRFEMTSSNAYSFTAAGSTFTNTNTGTISNAAIAGVIFFTEGAGPAPDGNLYIGQMTRTNTLYSYESVATVAPDVERTTAPPPSAYSLWAQGYNLNVSGNGAPTADPDGDGFANDMEFAFGTSPIMRNVTMLRITQSGTKAVVSFVARKTGVTYTVLQKTGLAAVSPGWADAGVTFATDADQSGIIDTANYNRVVFTTEATGRNFYRVRATFSQ